MAKAPKKRKRNIENYAHRDKERANNPPVGLVTPETDQDAGRKTYAHDPHVDPQLSWAGKAEHTAFEVLTVSLTSTSASTRARRPASPDRSPWKRSPRRW